MKIRLVVNSCSRVVVFLALGLLHYPGLAADKLVGIHSARTMSQSMPWIAGETGLFRKYDLDFQMVYIVSASLVTAAILGGEAIIHAFAHRLALR